MYRLFKPFVILYVYYLQYTYKRLTLKWRDNQTNNHLYRLRLLKFKLYYYRNQFEPNGYYHPSSLVTKKGEDLINKLFPEPDFKELELVIWFHPEAVVYYHNRIHDLKGNSNFAYSIIHFLKKHKRFY